MPNKKKKAPRNAFSFYLDDAMDELRREGHKISKKSDAVPLVFDKWKNLPDDDKKKYQNMADKWKIEKRCAPRMGRLDCTGMPVDNRINLDVEIALKHQEQRRLIRANWATRYGISKEPFYFISFQSYYEFPNEEGYHPCEVACIKFSLRNGIEKEWHAFIDPGALKPGLGAEAKIFTEKTHQIPIYGFELARQDHHAIWSELIQFVEKEEKNGEKTIPPLFCKASEMHKTDFCLNFLSALAGVSNRLGKVYYLEDLVTELYEKVNVKAPSSVIIEDALSSSILDYENNTKCEFHHEIERIHCAVLTVKKACFWMSDAFHEHYNYELTEKHMPMSDVEYGMLQPGEGAWRDHEAARHVISSSVRNKSIAYQKSSTTGEMEETRMANTDIRYRDTPQNEDRSDRVGAEGNGNDADGEDSDTNEKKFPLRRPKSEILKIIEAKKEAFKREFEKVNLAAHFPEADASNRTMQN